MRNTDKDQTNRSNLNASPGTKYYLKARLGSIAFSKFYTYCRAQESDGADLIV